jgi:hypothetical protein
MGDLTKSSKTKIFKELPEDVMTSYCKSSHVVYDLKYVLEKGQVDIRL